MGLEVGDAGELVVVESLHRGRADGDAGTSDGQAMGVRAHDAGDSGDAGYVVRGMLAGRAVFWRYVGCVVDAGSL